MSVKAFIYILSSIIVIWSIDSVNINKIFKLKKEIQAKVFYFIIVLCMIKLLTNCIIFKKMLILLNEGD